MRECDHAKAFWRLVRIHQERHPELRLVFHIPNGGSRNRREAACMAGEGVVPGVPDYFCAVPRGMFHGLFIELKSLEGRVSSDQRDWIARLTAEGYNTKVAYGWEDAWEKLTNYLGIPNGYKCTRPGGVTWAGGPAERRAG